MLMSDNAQPVVTAQVEVAGAPAPAKSSAALQAERRAATLAALESGNLDGLDADVDGDAAPKDSAKGPKKPATSAEPEDDDADEDDDLEDDDEDDDLVDSDDEDDDSEDDEDETDEDDEDEDPALDHKKLAAVKKAERRARQIEARAQASLAEARRIEESVKERVTAAERFEKLVARIPYEGLSPLLDLVAPNLDDETLELAARELFSRSSKGAKDAAGKAAIADRQRQRELRDELAALKKRLEDKDEDAKKQAAAAEGEREGRAYLAKLVKRSARGEETPLAAKALAKGAKARDIAIADLATIAARLAERAGGVVPSTKKVLRAFENRLRALRDDDTTPSATAITAKGGTKNRSQTADENRPAPTSDDGDQPPKDLRARRAWTARRLEAGQFD